MKKQTKNGTGGKSTDMTDFLTEEQAGRIVDAYLENEKPSPSTQDILDSGAVPRLKGYRARPGKVSDCIFGGRGDYLFKQKGQPPQKIEFENPPLDTRTGEPLILMVRTARISTHDINRGVIPLKDQILAMNHHYMARMLAHAIGTSQFAVPGLSDNSVVIAAEKLAQLGFENVLRAFMAKSTTETSLYVHYMRGEREFCGHRLPEGLVANGPLPYVMDTPSTKSDEHDESLSSAQLVERGICTPEQYAQIRNNSIFAFGIVDHFLRSKGIIPVDTKTEHGINRRGEIVVQDEVWTMDSSRFWLEGDYAEQMRQFLARQIGELNPKSYSKEFARGFSEGDRGYTQEQRALIAVRYIMGIQSLLGQRFEPDTRSREERVVTGLNRCLDCLVG